MMTATAGTETDIATTDTVMTVEGTRTGMTVAMTAGGRAQGTAGNATGDRRHHHLPPNQPRRWRMAPLLLPPSPRQSLERRFLLLQRMKS